MKIVIYDNTKINYNLINITCYFCYDKTHMSMCGYINISTIYLHCFVGTFLFVIYADFAY